MNYSIDFVLMSWGAWSIRCREGKLNAKSPSMMVVRTEASKALDEYDLHDEACEYIALAVMPDIQRRHPEIERFLRAYYFYAFGDLSDCAQRVLKCGISTAKTRRNEAKLVAEETIIKHAEGGVIAITPSVLESGLVQAGLKHLGLGVGMAA